MIITRDGQRVVAITCDCGQAFGPGPRGGRPHSRYVEHRTYCCKLTHPDHILCSHCDDRLRKLGRVATQFFNENT